MASWAGAADVETPQVARRPRHRPSARAAVYAKARPFGGVVWIVVLAVLLAGIVAVNVAVLQLNLRLDELGRERVQLRADTQRLSSQLSSASANARIESQARTQARARPCRPGVDLPRAAGAVAAMNERRSNRRIRLLLGVFALVFAGTLARAVWLQGVQASTLEQMASRQHQATTEIPAGRGTIYDRTGEPLAIGEEATTIYADPRSVKEPRKVALAVAKTLGLDAEKLYPLLSDHSRHFVYVKRKADPAKAAELEKLKLPGLGFYAEELRYYPQRGVAAHVLGYAGIDNKGLEGLERSLDKSLIGKPGSQTTVTDPTGRVIDVVSTKPERAGDDVYLTIDHRIQANAETILRETVKRWGAKGGTAIVLDPRSGGVLAMAVAPGFDANAFGTASADRRRNRAVTDVYEPGSTFKVVTVAAALSEKIVTPTTPFTLAYLDPRRRPDHPRARAATDTADDGRADPLAVVERRHDHARPDARTHARRELDLAVRVRQVDRSRCPGRVARPLAELLVRIDDRERPDRAGHRRHTDPDGDCLRHDRERRRHAHAAPRRAHRRRADEQQPGRRVISKTVSAQMMAMLRDVVSAEGGTGAAAKVPGYTVAGKTGTAAKPVPGGYSTSRYVASFVGVVPAKDPRLVVLVQIDEPRGAIWGGVVAAPAFSEIARSSLVELEVAPDATPDATATR